MHDGRQLYLSILKMIFYLVTLCVLVYIAIGCMPDGHSNKVLFINSYIAQTHNQSMNSVKQVTLGKDTYVCVVLGPLDWVENPVTTYLKLPTEPTADRITRIRIGNCECSAVTALFYFICLLFLAWTHTNYTLDSATKKLNVSFDSGHGVGVTVSSMGVTSFQKVLLS